MKHFCANGMPMAFWKRFSKADNNSFFAPPSPAQGDKVIHDYLSCSGMDDCSAICLDKKFDKSQGCMPLCYLALNNLNDFKLAKLTHKIIFNGSSSARWSSRHASPFQKTTMAIELDTNRHARPLETGEVSLAGLIIKDVLKPSPTLAQPYNEPRMSLQQPYNEPIISLAQAKDELSASLSTPFLYPASSEGSPKDETTNTQETANNDTRNVRLVYRECTVSVRGVYRKGTREPLRSYWRATTDLLNACSSTVAQQYTKRQLAVASLTSKAIPWVAVWLCCMLFSVSDALAQSAEPRTADGQSSIKPLQIGDTIPEELWNLPLQVVNHPDGKDTITLNDYRDKKLIILDFWATWCGSCIDAMARIHKLQDLYPEDLVVIPITYEDKDKLEKFLSSNSILEHLNLFSLAEDKQLKIFFPHRTVPHYVWIQSDGKFLSATTSQRVNKANVELAIQGKGENLVSKKDIDPDHPLFLSESMDPDEIAHYSVLRKSYYDGLPSGSRFRKTNNRIRGRAITNSTILSLYEAAIVNLFNQKDESYTRKRRIIHVKDTSLLYIQEPDPLASGDIHANLYNYELIVPLESADSLYTYMIEDLNRYTGYSGRVEKVKTKCLVMHRTGDIELIKSKGGEPESSLFFKAPAKLTNQPLKLLVNRMNEIREIPYPVVDETGITVNVDLRFSGRKDLDTLRRELEEQQINLIEDYRDIYMFILEDKKI